MRWRSPSHASDPRSPCSTWHHISCRAKTQKQRQWSRRALRADGVDLRLGVKITGTRSDNNRPVVEFEDPAGSQESVTADQLLVAVGRAPNTDNIGLEDVGVEFDRQGVVVDSRLRTTNPRIFAAGDVVKGPLKFTHVADAHAGIVIQNALFFGRKRTSSLVVPWCTYTTPEIAHVGLYEQDAKEKGIETSVIEIALDDVDRALLDGQDEGFLKLILKKGTDKILGATVVADHAGDMIGVLSLAVTHEIGLSKFAGTIFPYPTQGEVIKKAANAWTKTRLSPTVKRLFDTWFRIF